MATTQTDSEDKSIEQEKLSRKRRLKAKAREEAKNFANDFRAFAFKGNVIDLAVGVVIGAAFNKIVSSLVADIIQPIVGKIIGNTAFTDLYINLSSTQYDSLKSAEAASAPVIRYGLFLSNCMDFLIVALTLFIVLKYLLRYKREEKM